MNRRGFIGSILAACAAPAIVRADSLMRIVPVDTDIIRVDLDEAINAIRQKFLADAAYDAAFCGAVREISQYDIYRDETMYRWDVMGVGPNGLPIQLGVDMRDIKPGDREIAIATLRTHANREGLIPTRGVLEIPPGMRGSFV